MRKLRDLLLALTPSAALLLAIVSFVWLTSPQDSEAQPTVIGPGNAILCNVPVSVAVGVSGVTQILALSTGKVINLCGYSFTNTAAAGTFQLSYGTGSNCGNGNVTITPVLSVGATAVTDHAGFAYFSTPASQALCVNPSVATISGVVYVSQF